MHDFEKLGAFYLGKEYDLEKGALTDNLLLYDSKDLVTHAVCVGMTGSGKTGLCIGLLEEAVIDHIPAIVVDPKGDLPNLLLTFPGLNKDEFRPWINDDDARKKGMSPDEYAAQQADLWKKGLAEWGQDPTRITRLRESADFTVYTPGSNAGYTVSILKSFAKPEPGILQDTDLLRERINTTVTSLLNLIGIDADPIQSREHILLSSILEKTWLQGEDLDLAGLIHAIQTPPVSRIGVFDLESFFPSKDRFALAMRLNNLLAAPGFSTWLEGEALDMDRMLYTSEGKPRVSIFSISHLNDAERMFFVSLLLTQLLGWMRNQSGTTSLRALFYMDEIFGFFPPVANPPSKAPLLTLLKQARAYGLGIVLATQNPVDLDYKGLSNTGTWFIGRLQTDRDKQRVLDGLEGAGATAGIEFNRRRTEQILAGLGRRVFLMNNVNEDAPVTFQTRWVMSYLRGPLTRNQIKHLMDEKKANTPVVEHTDIRQELPATEQPHIPGQAKPVLPPDIPQYFIPIKSARPAGTALLYEPMIFGSAKVYFSDKKTSIDTEEMINCLTEFSDRHPPIDWGDAQPVDLTLENMANGPDDENAGYGKLHPEASRKQSYTTWSRAFNEWLFRNQTLDLYKSPSMGIVSLPDESERDFRIRLQLKSHEKRDEVVDALRKKYATRITRLQERIRTAEDRVRRQEQQASQQKMQAAISVGSALLGAFMGRKTVTQGTIGRATTAARGTSRARKGTQDVERVKENLATLEQQLTDLQGELEREINAAKLSIDPSTEKLESVQLKPKKTNISVSVVALTWVPYWQDERGNVQTAW